MDQPNDGPDSSSLKPVSSLLSRFENLGKDAEPPKTPTAGQRQFSLNLPNTAASDRPRSPTTTKPSPPVNKPSPPAPSKISNAPQNVAVPRQRRASPQRPRPHTMIDLTPTQKSPPMVTVDSPKSPPKGMSIDPKLANGVVGTQTANGSPTRGHMRSISRGATPSLEKRMSAFMKDAEPIKPHITGSKPAVPTPDGKPSAQKANGPPPVNRAAKPKVPSKPANLAKPAEENLTAPEPSAAELTDHSTSPFNTPPSSRNSSPAKSAFPTRARNESDASFVERLRGDSDASLMTRARNDSDASWVQRLRGDSDASVIERARAGSSASFVESSTLSESPQHHQFEAPPVHHHVAARREQQMNGLSRTPTMPARYRQPQRNSSAHEDDDEDRPRLPARPELQMRSGRTSPTKLRSGRTSPSKLRSGRTSPSKLVHQITAKRSMDLPHRSNTVHETGGAHRIPATKPNARSALALGFDRTTSAENKPQPALAPAVPAPRRSMDRRPQQPQQTPQQQQLVRQPPPLATNGHSRDDEEDELPGGNPAVGPGDFPDASNASRRPPRYRQRPHQIFTDYDTRLVAVCGEYVCTSGYITKVWNLRTGEQVMNMAHHENLKVSSVVFKPSADINLEGTRIWLGTNVGEIHEVDIPSQSLIKTKSNAHRREVIRMFRHASELWTLDDGGELNVWQKDHKGMPSLDSQANNFRVPKGHTFSIACGEQLWIATGKDIRVFLPGSRSDTGFQVLRQPLSQPNTGDITSGATISSKPDLVYFGHTDGKVSIYNRRTFAYVGIVNVSVYKISSLAGVGDYLWAGYNTGMAYVYDVSTTPWKVKKDWTAHGKQICSIVADPSAIWKMDRLQVVTLGTDNMLKLWDGLLEEDWLDTRMHEHDSDYCDFREIRVGVLTWNAGASKPGHLQYNQQDNNFFRDYVTSGDPPEIFVFGFQELVDLEDKKTTAKAFFKSKKKDPADQEHMSHQYRAWRDYLNRCIEDHMPPKAGYTLLHTASMVGLFTCIFVRTSLRQRIKYVHTSEIKRGMGGLHGNKGALVLRLVLDDSSLCFLNCHLAAGQTQTIHRNNDIAAILEAESLPAYPLAQSSADITHADVFTSGGDGSMILDHEICILNGDLNYRIDTMGRDTVIKHIQQRNLPRLLERDQLLLSRKKNPGFRLRAFAEAPITFAPTYKYNVQTDEYDTSEKRRAPAWCDRVLYRGLGKVKCEEYRRWEIRVSDHRPVSARLRVRIKSVDPARRSGVWERCLDEFEVVRGRVRQAVQIDYLTNVLGMPQKDAVAALRG